MLSKSAVIYMEIYPESNFHVFNVTRRQRYFFNDKSSKQWSLGLNFSEYLQKLKIYMMYKN
jgi:hypothetical protein